MTQDPGNQFEPGKEKGYWKCKDCLCNTAMPKRHICIPWIKEINNKVKEIV